MTDKAFEHRAAALRQRAEQATKALGVGAMVAEDIAQDVMLKLWAMRGDLEERNLEALAAIMARRMSLNILKDRRLSLNAEILLGATCSPEEILEEKENERWLEQRLARLPRTQHIILEMRQVERRSLEEIARQIGIEETSVSTLLARARRALLQDIKQRNGR